MKTKTLFILVFSFWAGMAMSQISSEPKVIAGPMNGYAEHTEALVWVQTRCAEEVSVAYRIKGSQKPFLVRTENKRQNLSNICAPSITKFVLTQLEMGKEYEYEIWLNGKPVSFPYTTSFKTKVLWEWRTPPPDFTFMLGSCLYVNDSAYDRPGKPYGQGVGIFKSMISTPADFMLWLGDNVYMREPDYSSESGMEYRYQHTRSLPEMQPFLAKMQHYATWDDHDYGDNDANRSFELKEKSLQLFKDYWGNKVYGENGQGIYSNFRFGDAEFFLCDDRYFRDETELDEKKYKKAMLGEQQLIWLKNKLKHSKASFKFIVVGGQVLNENTDKESYNLYKAEREEILKFIVDQKIGGVIFLSGDRHHTELIKNDKLMPSLGYPLYDLTASALTSGASNVASSAEKNNPQRVPGTLLAENNYCTIRISGPKRGERSLLITCYDAKGIVKWGQTIEEKELKPLK